MLESDIQRDIIKYLESKDCLVFRMNSGYAKKNIKLAPNGTPDLLVISKHGNNYWLEIKNEKGTLRDSQIKMHNRLNKRCQEVIVARSVEDIEDLI